MKLETRVETIENVLEAEELIGTLTYYVDKFGAHGEVYVHSSTRYAYGEEEPELTIVYKSPQTEEERLEEERRGKRIENTERKQYYALKKKYGDVR